jgi:pimeloyl-ACP methyl ester carboxylesterase
MACSRWVRSATFRAIAPSDPVATYQTARVGRRTPVPRHRVGVGRVDVREAAVGFDKQQLQTSAERLVMLKWLLRIGVGLVAAIVLLLATGYGYESVSERLDARRFDPPGQLIDIGGYRLTILCKGDAPGPTVVIEAGGGVGALGYLTVQDEIARFARVCSYDRAGLGWSEPGPAPRTFEAYARELNALLEAARVRGPYVLVAHSWGGGVARAFARDRMERLAGFALIETGGQELVPHPMAQAAFARSERINRVAAVLHRFGVIRLFPQLLGPYADASDEVKARLLRPGTFAAMAAEGEAIRADRGPGWTSLGDLPLVVVVRGRPDMGDDPDFERAWIEANRRLSDLSTNSAVIVADRSGHMVHLDQPNVYVDAVRSVVTAAREGRPLQSGSEPQP